jgi:hypothetical protein
MGRRVRGRLQARLKQGDERNDKTGAYGFKQHNRKASKREVEQPKETKDVDLLPQRKKVLDIR